MTSPREYVRMKNRAMLSPAETRQIVLDRYRAGYQPYDIANRLGMVVSDVRLLLALEGIDAPAPTTFAPVHPMWDYEEDRKRQAIAKRAANGARETLRGLEQIESKTLSGEPVGYKAVWVDPTAREGV